MPYDLSALTLPHVLENSAEKYPDASALSWVDGEPLTYRELKDSAEALALILQEHGIKFGDSVAILAENSPNWGIAYFAIASMGAVAVPILTDFHSEAIHYIIRHSDTKAIFVSEKMFPKIEATSFDPAPVFISLETFHGMTLGTTRDMLKHLPVVDLKKNKAEGQTPNPTREAPHKPGEDDIAVIIYTSGTTGYSKGVVLTHKNIVYDAVFIRDYFVLGPNDRLLSLLPLPHTYECTVGLVLPILNGSHLFYLDRPPTARVLLPALAKVRPTALLIVPLIIEKLFRNTILPQLTSNKLRHTLYKISAIRKFLHRVAGKRLYASFGGELRILAIGGAPLAPVVERFLREGKFPYVVGYGLTEGAPLCTASKVTNTRYLSSGYALTGLAIKIDAPDENNEGELLLQGPNLMRGYYKSPQDTESVFTKDGWLRTGDLARIDENGYVYIRGRCKNLILGPSGENIYPEEVETIINQMDYVVESLVIESKGKLVAHIHLASEELDTLYPGISDEERSEKEIALLEKIRTVTNSRVSSFIRIHKAVLQPTPFEKTPTQKIKRYLYTGP